MQRASRSLFLHGRLCEHVQAQRETTSRGFVRVALAQCVVAPSLPLREFLCDRQRPTTVLLTGAKRDLLRMPPGQHYSRSASFVCHWHTGCNKRFSSKRQLYRHLQSEHNLQRDAERGWRAPGVGSRARRREIRKHTSLARWRETNPCTFLSSLNNASSASQRLSAAPPLGNVGAAGCGSSEEHGASRGSAPPLAVADSGDRCEGPRASNTPFISASERASRVTFALPAVVLGSPTPNAASDAAIAKVTFESGSAVSGLPGGSHPVREAGRKAVMRPSPAGLSAARPRLSASSAARPPSGPGGSLAAAAMPPETAEKPPASSADGPPFTTCDEGLRAVSFGVSPRPVPDRLPAGPCGDVDDDLWAPSPRRWNTWTRDSGVDVAKVRL